MAESHTYLNCVHSNNALVTNYYQLGKGEIGESTEKYVLSASEMGLIVNVTCVITKPAERCQGLQALRGGASYSARPS